MTTTSEIHDQLWGTPEGSRPLVNFILRLLRCMWLGTFCYARNEQLLAEVAWPGSGSEALILKDLVKICCAHRNVDKSVDADPSHFAFTMLLQIHPLI
jgi:hypothetical protein